MNLDLDALLNWFETLTPQSLTQLQGFYAPQVHFRDPFNDFHSRERLTALFAEMFVRLQNPRFSVIRKLAGEQAAYLTWHFHFGLGGKQWQIEGVTELHWNQQGLITSHYDYWDAAGQVYERLPFLGFCVRQLKRLMS